MLEVTDLSVMQDGKPVLQGVNVTVKAGEVTALLGANGAGKSELVLSLAGLLPNSSGSVRIDGKNITGLKPDKIRAAGLATIPEGHQVLAKLTVDDNLRAAGSLLNSKELRERALEVYQTFPELEVRKTQMAGTLSGGQQQMLAIGHALMTRPRYMLIDEMSLGLAPLIVKRLVGVIRQLVADGVGVLLVEQFVEVALELATEVVVLRKGEVRLASPATEIRTNRDLLTKAYL